MARVEVLVVAGEASGDQHAAAVVHEIKALRPELHFFGMGGTQLAAENVELLYGAHEVSVMGIAEVLPKVRRILKVMKGLEKAAGRRQPRCAFLVDIPDFNLRLARRLRALGIPVVYYVSPTVWAWRTGRVDTVSARVNEMLCILPFEEPFYARHGVPAKFVGNPVVEQVPAPAPAAQFRQMLNLPVERPTLALLPGSRRSELKRILKPMAEAARLFAKDHPGLHVVVPVAPGRSREELAPALTGLDVTFVEGQAPEVVGASDAAVVASGTAALEAGLMQRPMIVVYRVSPVTYFIAKPMMKVKHFSLVNLLAGRELVPELIQKDLTPQNIAEWLKRLWPPSSEGAQMTEGLKTVRQSLGNSGAAKMAARATLKWVDT